MPHTSRIAAGCLLWLGGLLAACTSSRSTPTARKYKYYATRTTRYRRAYPDSTAVVTGSITTRTGQKAEAVSATLFVDKKSPSLYDADRLPAYLLTIPPGKHLIQVVTVTYYNASAKVRVRAGDSLRPDFQLRQDMTGT